MLVTILSGIPGSGKTTLAKKLVNDPKLICSADDFFEKDGKYTFDVQQIGKAHKSCQDKCANLMVNKTEKIVIANTNTTLKEMEIYFFLANHYKYDVHLMEPSTSWRYNVAECTNKTVHNVPTEKIDQMLNRLVSLDDAKRHFSQMYPDLKISVEIDNGKIS